MNIGITIRRALPRAISIACLTLVFTSAGCETVCDIFLKPTYGPCLVVGPQGCSYQVFYDDGFGCGSTAVQTTVTVSKVGAAEVLPGSTTCERICFQSCISCPSGSCS
jgi:hypothetical protein